VENYKCGKCDNCSSRKAFPTASLDYVKEILLQSFREFKGTISEKELISFLRGKSIKDECPGLTNFSTLINYSSDEIKSALNSLLNEQKIVKAEGKGRFYAIVKDKNDRELFRDEKKSEPITENIELFHRLRELRYSVSKRFLQTPDLICSDNILSQISRIKPRNKSELKAIAGFNQRMFNKIGAEILEEVNRFSENQLSSAPTTKIPDNILDTYNLLIKGHTLQEIASLKKLDEAVISMQIETILQYSPDTDISSLMEKAELIKIYKEIDKGYTNLKELKSRLDKNISYALLRIAVAKKKYTKSHRA
jgi:hypothetical protein